MAGARRLPTCSLVSQLSTWLKCGEHDGNPLGAAFDRMTWEVASAVIMQDEMVDPKEPETGARAYHDTLAALRCRIRDTIASVPL